MDSSTALGDGFVTSSGAPATAARSTGTIPATTALGTCLAAVRAAGDLGLAELVDLGVGEDGRDVGGEAPEVTRPGVRVVVGEVPEAGPLVGAEVEARRGAVDARRYVGAGAVGGLGAGRAAEDEGGAEGRAVDVCEPDHGDGEGWGDSPEQVGSVTTACLSPFVRSLGDAAG